MDKRWIIVLVLVVVASSAVAGFFAYRTPRHVVAETKYPAAHHSPITLTAESDFTRPGAGSGCECVRSGSGTELTHS